MSLIRTAQRQAEDEIGPQPVDMPERDYLVKLNHAYYRHKRRLQREIDVSPNAWSLFDPDGIMIGEIQKLNDECYQVIDTSGTGNSVLVSLPTYGEAKKYAQAHFVKTA
jgi:hypothetical protein